MRFPRPTQQGNIHVYAAVGLVLVVIVSLLVVAGRTSGKRSPQLPPLPAYQAQLMKTLGNAAAWKHTLNDPQNTSLRCLSSGEDCRNSQGAFRLHDPIGRVIHDPYSPATGADLIGTPCAPPGKAVPCAIGVSLVWKPLCHSDANCTAPIAKVIGTFESKAAPGAVKDGRELAKYRFEMNIVPGKGGVPEGQAPAEAKQMAEPQAAPEGEHAPAIANPTGASSPNAVPFAGAEPAPGPAPAPAEAHRPEDAKMLPRAPGQEFKLPEKPGMPRMPVRPEDLPPGSQKIPSPPGMPAAPSVPAVGKNAIPPPPAPPPGAGEAIPPAPPPPGHRR